MLEGIVNENSMSILESPERGKELEMYYQETCAIFSRAYPHSMRVDNVRVERKSWKIPTHSMVNGTRKGEGGTGMEATASLHQPL